MPSEDEVRNLPPRSSAFWVYTAFVSATGALLLIAAIPKLTGHDFQLMGKSFIAVAALLVLTELRPLVTSAAPDTSDVSTSTAFVFALLIHWGLAVALLMETIATVLGDVVRQKAPWRTAFNVAQYALSLGAAASVLAVFGKHPTPQTPVSVDGAALPALALAAVAYYLLNNGLASGAVSVRRNSPLHTEFFAKWRYQLAANAALLGLAPIVVLVVEQGPALVPLLVLPLAAVYATAAMSLERERQAVHDPLTGLPNRKLLVREADAAFAEAATDGRRVALFLLDLDRFKEINDTLGHPVGDSLLELVARRLESTVREYDVVARLGGDEFAILTADLDDTETALDLAALIRSSLGAPFRTDGMSFEIEGSIGIAVYPDHGRDFESLLRRADVAMYVSKELHTGIELYSDDMDQHATARLGMVAELRGALDGHELELHYQPKADLRSGDIVGVEALLRWQHPERGSVPPGEFVPVAEQTGLMRSVTQFVVDEALRQVAAWWRSGVHVQCAVNVCARELYDRDFAAYLRGRLDHFGVPPRALVIEVTESVLMADPTRAANTLLSLSDLGVGISLDDFGTGYSSLVHLKRLPVSEVKIDRSFVMRLEANDDDAAIVRSIIDLSGALGLRVVAEGVETREAWDRLSVLGCDAVQGWYLSKAQPGAEITEWMKKYSQAQTLRRLDFQTQQRSALA